MKTNLMVYDLGQFTFDLLEGDITQLKVDAVVNAANTNLILGSGVAGAIRRKGGPSIQEECNKLAPIRTGEAVITRGGMLPAKFVIHTAGPVYNKYSESEAIDLLKNSVLNSLEVLMQNKLTSIAFPAISAGVYGFPAEKCAEVMISNILNFIKGYDVENIPQNSRIMINICLFESEMFQTFQKVAKKMVE